MGTLVRQSPSWRKTPYSGLLRVADLNRSPSHLVLATAIFPVLSLTSQSSNRKKISFSTLLGARDWAVT